MKKAISITAGAIILIIGSYACSKLSEQKERPEKRTFEKIPNIKTTVVTNTTIDNHITAYGKGYSKDKIEIFSEVTGSVLESRKKFKEGVKFSKGETLIRIKSTDFYMNLLSLRSSFLNTLTGLVADMQIDFPENSEAWIKYLSDFEVEKTTPSLPETKSDKEKYYITTHNIYNQYYSIKNAEATLSKYSISAPTNGTVTLSTINTGSLVRPGQKLGEFIGTSVFEMEAGVHASMIEQIKPGMEAVIYVKGEDQLKRRGKITRVNNAIEPQTQLVKVYIEMDGAGLKDGVYLTADIHIGEVNDVVKIPRFFLNEDRFVYLIKEDRLDVLDVEIINSDVDSVIVKGIPDNSNIAAQQVRGGFKGMKIKTYQ